jgi:hypothetical protein
MECVYFKEVNVILALYHQLWSDAQEIVSTKAPVKVIFAHSKQAAWTLNIVALKEESARIATTQQSALVLRVASHLVEFV